MRAAQQRVKELEDKLAAIYLDGRRTELSSAEQDYSAARMTVADLQQMLDDHKAEVASFNRVYATHEALAGDLVRLEELHRAAQAQGLTRRKHAGQDWDNLGQGVRGA